MSFINWGLFEIPGVNLDDIDIPVVGYSEGDLPSKDDVLTAVELFRENVDKLRKAVEAAQSEGTQDRKGQKEQLKLKMDPEALDNYLTRITSELASFKVDPDTLNRFLMKISTPTLTGTGHGTHFLISPTRRSLVLDMESDIGATLIGFSNTMARGRPPRIKTSFRDHNTPETFVDLIDPSIFLRQKNSRLQIITSKVSSTSMANSLVESRFTKGNRKAQSSMGVEQANTHGMRPFRLKLAYVQEIQKKAYYLARST